METGRGGIGREGKDAYAESSSARRATFIGAWMYDDDMLPAYMRDNGSHTLTCMLCHAIGYGNISKRVHVYLRAPVTQEVHRSS